MARLSFHSAKLAEVRMQPATCCTSFGVQAGPAGWASIAAPATVLSGAPRLVLLQSVMVDALLPLPCRSWIGWASGRAPP